MKINKEYKEFTKNIIEDEHFQALKEDNHHGTNRFEHCKRVSYLSYLLTKMLKGKEEEAAVAGLLHDFFYGETNSKVAISYLNHPKMSAKNAKKYFNINDNETKIIETHMYHYALVKSIFPFINKDEKIKSKNYRPTSKEGFIVCLSDLLVSIFEVGRYKIKYDTCLYILFLMNIIK